MKLATNEGALTSAGKVLKNEKGLTLIELLAVIVILAIIAAIAIPSIGGIIAKTKKESHRANAQMILDAARYKVSVEDFKPDSSGNVSVTLPDGTTQSLPVETVTLKTLVDDGFLEAAPKDPQGSGTYNDTSTVVKIYQKTDGKYEYAITLIGDSTYFSGVWAQDVKTATIGSSPAPTP
ncbi:MAG TPA: prepilin-type N-terminal cleavage/methylation domain-containing protein [Bacilli bacterium]